MREPSAIPPPPQSRQTASCPPQQHRRQRLNFQGINAAALAVLPALLTRWLPGGHREGHEFLARNPRRADRSPGSFKVSLRTGQWADFATGDAGGDVVSLAAYLFEMTQAEAARRVAEAVGVDHA